MFLCCSTQVYCCFFHSFIGRSLFFCVSYLYDVWFKRNDNNKIKSIYGSKYPRYGDMIINIIIINARRKATAAACCWWWNDVDLVKKQKKRRKSSVFIPQYSRSLSISFSSFCVLFYLLCVLFVLQIDNIYNMPVYYCAGFVIGVFLFPFSCALFSWMYMLRLWMCVVCFSYVCLFGFHVGRKRSWGFRFHQIASFDFGIIMIIVQKENNTYVTLSRTKKTECSVFFLSFLLFNERRSVVLLFKMPSSSGFYCLSCFCCVYIEKYSLVLTPHYSRWKK